MKKALYPIAVICLLAANLTCKKEKPEPAQGNISISVEVVHHTLTVTNSRVFLDANATSFPGTDTTVYNWSDSVDMLGKVTFSGLFTGNYYLYSKGFDGADSLFGDTAIVLSEADAYSVVETVLAVLE